MPSTVKLNDGNELPTIAYGTGTALFGHDATEYVGDAIESGFSHIDTAAMYANEESVGIAIKESGLPRDQLYITTKYDGGDIHEAIDTSLSKLGLKSVDLYLIHFPGAIKKSVEDAWKEFEKIKETGLAKSIGVSNYNVEQLQEIIKTAHIKPSVNQIRFHPYNYTSQKAVVEYGAKHGIITAAYSSLTSITKTPGGPVDPVVAAIGKRINATPAQVLLAWVRAKGIVVVTTTSRRQRMKEYLSVEDRVVLSDDDVSSIDKAGAEGPPSKLRSSLFYFKMGVSGFLSLEPKLRALIFVSFVLNLSGIAFGICGIWVVIFYGIPWGN